MLRSIAILIAVAGAIDPAWSISRPEPQKVIAIRMTASPVPAIEQALRDNLRGWDVTTREPGARVPCAPGERCVLIADGSIDADLPADLTTPPALIEPAPVDGPNVSVRSVSAARAHQAASGVARVELAAHGVEGKQSEIRILDGAAVVGSVMHKWSGAAATVDVPWWPIATGASALRVEAVPLEGERTTIDNRLDIGVSVETTRSPVLVFDARPSWTSTFIRRAIEDDPRFTVGYRARLAPALSAGTANGRLDVAALDLATVVIIGGPDALTASEVQLLDQYVRVRGGTLILLPERVPAEPAVRLFGGTWSEHLVATPEPVGVLRATEILRLERPPVAAAVLARSGSAAAIVSLPSGNGNVVVSGAMDAWRYRQVGAGTVGGFDAFWRSLIADGASQGAGLQLSFERSLIAAGGRTTFSVRDRRMSPDVSSEANATMTCGTAPASTVRLWPGGALGEFTGDVSVPAAGSCVMTATVGDRSVTGSIVATERPVTGVERTLASLEKRITAAGGAIAIDGDAASLARVLQQQPAAQPVVTAVHPMQSAWWLLPFAGCLSAEWWLRRRNGSA